MTSDNVFGSDQLTPELLRSAAFAEEDGRVDAAEVRTFLDRVASSLEVFMSGDAPTALRAEFDRNAAIATQILDAGQTASEQLRRQAAEEAKRILDEAREATLGLRETVEVEIEQARSQVEAMRGTFIHDLRDLYDRIGASLYRFERAAEESAVAPIQEPSRASEPTGSAAPATHSFSADVSDAPISEPAPAPAPARTSGPGARRAGERPEDQPDGLPDLPEGAKAPAWQQLPPEAWQATAAGDDPMGGSPSDVRPEDAPAPAPAPETLAAEVPADVAPPADPFAPVIEDEPLAPGEPLVDLRGFGEAVDEAETLPTPSQPTNVTESGGSWLDTAQELPPAAPQVDELPPLAPQAAGADAPEADAPPADAPSADAGSWLEAPLDPDPAAGAPADPALARDDALANALIGAEPVDAEAPPAAAAPLDAGAAPAPPTDAAPAPDAGAAAMAFPTAGASPDAVAVRQLILDSLAAGQTREAVETYLREHMGLLEPGALIDAALSSVEQA